ncbi:beige/beach-related [Anaeramoeba flamelloides]|uniref:Beige/beach-related n=1 Tax=Anaeramoeba flamelloides TaxID=1746091 RepID=A0ABQ8X4I9_9EUKA|nr:beige/beach-related [Anaeramoeba flamelloides]
MYGNMNALIISSIIQIIPLMQLIFYDEKQNFKLTNKKILNKLLNILTGFFAVLLYSKEYKYVFQFQEQLLLNPLNVIKNKQIKLNLLLLNIYILIHSYNFNNKNNNNTSSNNTEDTSNNLNNNFFLQQLIKFFKLYSNFLHFNFQSNISIKELVELINSNNWYIKKTKNINLVYEKFYEDLQNRILNFSTKYENDLGVKEKFNYLEKQTKLKNELTIFVQEKIKNKNIQITKDLLKLKETDLKKKNQSKRNWKNILRSLINERGPWNEKANNLENQNYEIYWKLDPSENSRRERRRLKRNYKFDNHAKASILRDYGGVNKSEEILKKLNKIEMELKLKQMEVDKKLNLNQNLDLKRDLEFEKELKLEKLKFDQLILKTQVEIIKPFKISKGILKITTNSIQFFGKFSKSNRKKNNQERGKSIDENNQKFAKKNKKSSRSNKNNQIISRDRIWYLDNIKEIHFRRYHLKPSAIEIFFTDQKIIFFNFDKQEIRNKFFNTILDLNPINLLEHSNDNISKNLYNSQLTKLWKNRQLSNFEYLMKLNKIAGRTYNDLCQYPVFPWVLKDYTSRKLDLNDPNVYRDLAKPVGMWNNKHQNELDLKFQEFAGNPEMGIIPFHYGSHYSNIGTVLYYLIRLEPFTTMAIELQGGKFDHPDRLFDSIQQTYENCYNSLSDVKELIPEFYYLPEFLENINEFDLGKKQNGIMINNIKLPPWANGSPEEFVRVMRMALESDYVSEHLNEWIDLIFGYKQKGEEAIKAKNVFYYLTYADEVEKLDLDNIENQKFKESIESQIENFGQTPCQLFKKPHPKRSPKDLYQLYSKIDLKKFKQCFHPTIFNHNSEVIFSSIFINDYEIFGTTSILFTFDKSRKITKYGYNFTQIQKNKMVFSIENDEKITNNKSIGLPFAEGIDYFCNCLRLNENGSVFFTCGYWDSSFRINHLSEYNQHHFITIIKHKDIVTCLSFDENVLVTGSRDTTAIIWFINNLSKNIFDHNYITLNKILFGHDDEITCIDLKHDLDTVITGSKDQTLIIHSLQQGNYIRTIKCSSVPKMIKILDNGSFLVYFPDKSNMKLFTLNGKPINIIPIYEQIMDWKLTRDKKYLITVGNKGSLIIRGSFHLNQLERYNFKSGLTSLALSQTNEIIVIGLKNGSIALSKFL